MQSLKAKKILIFQQRGWAMTIGHFLAKKLQDEGCYLAAFTLKRTTHDFVIKQEEVKYDLIINNDEIMSRPKDYLAGEIFSFEEICRELGVESIWPVIYTLRNHVKSYKDKYYYSFKQNVSDEEIIDYVMAVYKCIKGVFEKFNPDMIISPNFVSLPHIMFNLYAKKRGVKMLAVTDSKVKGIYIFSLGYNDDEGSFYKRVDALNNKTAETCSRERAKKYIKEFREKFKNPVYAEEMKDRGEKTFWQKIRHFGSPFYHILKWYFEGNRNYLESTGITPDYRPPRIILRDHYCNLRYRKFMERFNYYSLERIKKFVYFPLQFQPEASIDVAAPFFSNQIETARQIAMSMPGDYALVVKEHPAMIGLRSPSYIEKIARTANVKLIDYRVSSEEVLKKCDLVVSPNSTTLAEAAFLKKPAIQLGNLGTTLKLPNVFRCTDMTALSSRIKEILKIDLNSDEYERQLENYVAASYDEGVEINYGKIWERGFGNEAEKLWEVYYKQIMNSQK